MAFDITNQANADARALFARSITESSKETRYTLLAHLRTLLRTELTHEFVNWAVPLIATQVRDQASEVSSLACAILDEIISTAPISSDALRITLAAHPPLMTLPPRVSNPLLMHFVVDPAGIRYASESGWLSTAMSTLIEVTPDVLAQRGGPYAPRPELPEPKPGSLRDAYVAMR